MKDNMVQSGILESALLNRITNLKLAIAKLDEQYAIKEIDTRTYEKQGKEIEQQVNALEDYVKSLGGVGNE